MTREKSFFYNHEMYTCPAFIFGRTHTMRGEVREKVRRKLDALLQLLYSHSKFGRSDSCLNSVVWRTEREVKQKEWVRLTKGVGMKKARQRRQWRCALFGNNAVAVLARSFAFTANGQHFYSLWPSKTLKSAWKSKEQVVAVSECLTQSSMQQFESGQYALE